MWVIISWLLVGLITFIVICIHDYRGKEYEDCDFYDIGESFAICLVIGYIAPILLTVAVIDWKKFLYRIVNVGLKKRGEEHEM